MYSEEFIEALDNSPTYRRNAMELEKITDSVGIMQTAELSVPEQETPKDVEESETVEENKYYKTENIE